VRRLLGYTLLLIVAAAVTKASGTARTSSITNRYNSNYDATWNAINNLNGQFTADQLAFLKGLSPTQTEFLGNLGQMTAPTSYPLQDDPHGGSTWASNERDYVNAPIDMANDVVLKLIRQNFMTS
jgi:hypothetical protein